MRPRRARDVVPLRLVLSVWLVLAFVYAGERAGLGQGSHHAASSLNRAVSPADRKEYILETIGCGVALLDYDVDGWLDIFLLSGTRLEAPVRAATNRLYRNNRDGTFTDVTTGSGLEGTGWAMARPTSCT